MNIFVLHESPAICAIMHCDKHVVKMVIEYAQLLASVHRVIDDISDDSMPKLTHRNHPCAVWARESSENYLWLLCLYESTCREFYHRYKHPHATSRFIERFNELPVNLPKGPRTPFPLAMPDEYKIDSPVESYRRYYIYDKSRFATWKNRPVPEWFHIPKT